MPATIDIDVAVIPWSQRGSLLCLSSTAGHRGRSGTGADVYLITHQRPYGHPLFALRPLPGGHRLGPPLGFHRTIAPTTVHATPSSMQWNFKGTTVMEATFQGTHCLRFRGNVPLALDSDAAIDNDICPAYMFKVPSMDGAPMAIEYSFTTMKGFRFVATKGALSHVNGNQPENRNKRIQVEGTEGDPTWELLVIENTVTPTSDEFSASSYNPSVATALATTFEQTVEALSVTFDKFVRGLCPWSPTPSQTEILCAFVMWTSTVRVDGNYTRESILMSKLWMNKIWSWDNCINALGVSALDVDFALDQLQSLYDYQAPDGRLPDSVDWMVIEWGFTKPPIHGWTLRRLLEQHPDMDTDRLRTIYYHTAKFTEFWLKQRRTNKSALPWYSHGNDSGWDNSTAFDGQSVVVGADLAAFLIIQCDVLVQVAKRLGVDQKRVPYFEKEKHNLLEALVSELWNGESFVFKDALNGEARTPATLLRLIPLVAAEYLPKTIVEKMVCDIPKHLTEWGLATEQLDSKHYEPDGYWRGPIWAPPTLLIESGLRRAGYTEVADRISSGFLRLCETSGFAENYDAITGIGLRDVSYTWAASAYLVLKGDAAQRT